MTAVGRKRGGAPHNGRAGGRGRQAEDDLVRRDLSEGAPHGVQPAGEEGDLAPRRPHQRGMNTWLPAVADEKFDRSASA